MKKNNKTASEIRSDLFAYEQRAHKHTNAHTHRHTVAHIRVPQHTHTRRSALGTSIISAQYSNTAIEQNSVWCRIEPNIVSLQFFTHSIYIVKLVSNGIGMSYVQCIFMCTTARTTFLISVLTQVKISRITCGVRVCVPFAQVDKLPLLVCICIYIIIIAFCFANAEKQQRPNK